MATLTKSEKDFWARDLRELAQEKISGYDKVVEQCMEIARERVLDDMGIRKEWEGLKKDWGSIEEGLNDIEEALKDMEDRVKSLNRTVEHDVVHIQTDYSGQTYQSRSSVSISFNKPLLGGSSYNRRGLSEDWIDKIAKAEYLEGVLAEQGFTDLLELYKLRDGVRRNVYLATTSAQMQEFVARFADALGVDI